MHTRYLVAEPCAYVIPVINWVAQFNPNYLLFLDNKLTCMDKMLCVIYLWLIQVNNQTCLGLGVRKNRYARHVA